MIVVNVKRKEILFVDYLAILYFNIFNVFESSNYSPVQLLSLRFNIRTQR